LQVGCEIGYPPFELFADDGVTPTGLDIELGYEIGDILGVEVVFINTDFDGILAGIDGGKYDVAMSALTINDERKLQVNFSDPYIENWQSIVVRKGDTAIASDIDMDGKIVAMQDATTSLDDITKLTDEGSISADVRPYDHVTNAFDELRIGRVDCVLCDSVVADGYVAREPDAFEIAWVQSTVEGAEAELFGIAVSKSNEPLLAAINDALAELEENGILDTIRSDWLS